MHPDFADWHRVVSIEPKADELQKRWQAIETFGKVTTPRDLAELARLFYGRPSRDDQFMGRFRAAFKATDETFRRKDNDAELRVLAGACLVEHFQYDENGRSAAASLALTCANCQGLRLAPIGEIVTLAAEKLAAQSAALRDPGRVEEPPRLDLSGELRALKAAFSANTVTNLTDPLMSVVQQLTEAVGRLNSWAANAAQQQALRVEESDVLWWLYGGHSRDPVGPFSDLESPSACVVSAKDLAELTRRVPGPFAADAFLGSVLKLAHPELNGKVSIAEALKACKTDYLGRLLTGVEVALLGDLCPVHQAARIYLDSERKKGWLSLYLNAEGFQATEKLHPLDLAVQVYRERLLFRAMRSMEEGGSG